MPVAAVAGVGVLAGDGALICVVSAGEDEVDGAGIGGGDQLLLSFETITYRV